LLHHLCLLFLEPQTNSLTSGHEFLDASCYTAGFALNQGFSSEVVDAGIEAVVYEAGKHAHELLHLFPLHAGLELSLLSSSKSVHFEGDVVLQREKLE